MKKILLILFVVAGCLKLYAELDAKNQKSATELSACLNELPDYLTRRSQRLDSLSQARFRSALTAERVRQAVDLANEYKVQSVDSALMYLRLALADARALNRADDETEILLRIYSLFPLMGMSHEAIEGFEEINVGSLPRELRMKYYQAGGYIFSNTVRYYPEGRYQDFYTNKIMEMVDSLQNYTRGDKRMSMLISGFKHSLRHEDNLAVANLVEVLPQLKDNEPVYDCTAGVISDYYRDRPESRQLYLRYMIKRAVNSLRHGVVRPEVIAELGKEFCEEGYTELGEKCLRLALRTGEDESGPFRRFDRAEYSRYFAGEAESRSQTMVWVTVIILLLLCAAVVACVLMYNKMREIAESSAKSVATAESREADMRAISSASFSLVFSSVEQLREYNILVNRKLKAGQVKDLFAEVESGKYLQACNEKFFDSFDGIVMGNLPGFVEKLNSLLLPDKQLQTTDDGKLTPELRIAALMKVGVTESQKMSQLLGLSLNTIYTYRNRLKSRAKDREKFEENLRNL